MICQPLLQRNSRSLTRIMGVDSGEIGIRLASPVMFNGRQRLPTDTIGNFTLTLTNLIVGSAIQIETQAGASIENRTATLTSEVFTIPAYGIGSALNDLRIKVRKGSSAPYYKPFETLATAVVGAQSIYTAQQLDE